MIAYLGAFWYQELRYEYENLSGLTIDDPHFDLAII